MRPAVILDSLACGLVATLRLVPWWLALFAGRGLGRLASLVQRGKHNRTIENLNHAGSTSPRKSSRRAAEHAGMTLAEILWILGRRPHHIAPLVRIEGLDALHQAAEAGRGVLLVSAHLGNWELVAFAAARSKIPVAVVARPLKVARLESRLIEFRERCRIRTLLRGRPGTAMAAARWLRRGGILGCMMDRASQGARIVVPFLGKATNVPLGPAELAYRSGAAVVMGSAHRAEDGTTTVRFRSLPCRSREGPVRLAISVIGALDAEIRTRPEEWFWIYRRQPLLPTPQTVEAVVGDLGEMPAPAMHG
jgi:KDO2-lipid IV(A) lauroyltransferase